MPLESHRESTAAPAHAHRLDPPSDRGVGEGGYSTAELLGNAALAIGALGLIWIAIGDMGQEIVDWIGSQLMSD